MWTPFANELVGKLALKHVLDQLVFFLSFYQVFYSIHQHVEKLIYVSLLHRIYWRPINIFERLAKPFSIEKLFFSFHKTSKNKFELVENIFLRFLFGMIIIINLKNCFAERRNHEKLLDDRVHVARGSKVLHSNKSCF